MRTPQIASIDHNITSESAAVAPTPSIPSTSTAVCPSGSEYSTFGLSRQQGIERYGTTKTIYEDNDLLELFIDSYQPFTLFVERAFKRFD